MAEYWGDLLGGATRAAINFEAEVPYTPEELIPTPSDTLHVLSRKMQRAEHVMQAGGSLAVACGWMDEEGGSLDPENHAMGEMTDTELRLYKRWKIRPAEIPIDPVQERKVPDPKEKDKKRFQLLYRAFKVMMNRDDLLEDHFVYFRANNSGMMPLIVAISKLETARSALGGGQDLDPRALKELQAVNKLLGLCEERRNAIMREFNNCNAQIQNGVAAMIERRAVLAPPKAKYGEKTLGYNETQRKLGGPRIGVPSNWKPTEEQKRRAQLLRGTQGGAGRAGAGGADRYRPRPRMEEPKPASPAPVTPPVIPTEGMASASTSRARAGGLGLEGMDEGDDHGFYAPRSPQFVPESPPVAPVDVEMEEEGEISEEARDFLGRELVAPTLPPRQPGAIPRLTPQPASGSSRKRGSKRSHQ